MCTPSAIFALSRRPAVGRLNSGVRPHLKNQSLLPSIPLGAWLYAAASLALATIVWALILGHRFSGNILLWCNAFAVGAIFVLFGFSLWGLLILAPFLRRPKWLEPRQAATLSAACFSVQSALAGALTMIGVWPHPTLWFLGALPFAWSG